LFSSVIYKVEAGIPAQVLFLGGYSAGAGHARPFNLAGVQLIQRFTLDSFLCLLEFFPHFFQGQYIWLRGRRGTGGHRAREKKLLPAAIIQPSYFRSLRIWKGGKFSQAATPSVTPKPLFIGSAGWSTLTERCLREKIHSRHPGHHQEKRLHSVPSRTFFAIMGRYGLRSLLFALRRPDGRLPPALAYGFVG